MNQTPSQPTGYGPAPDAMQRVVVTDVSMTFGSMIVFMIKWALASVPAMLILSIIGFLVGMVFFALIAALGIAASH